MHGFGGAGKKESWLTPAQLWCTAGAFNANSLVWKKNRHCFHCFPYCWSKNVFQVLKCDRKYLGWVNCSSALMSKLLLLQHSQAHSMFWLFTSDVSPCTLILFLSFILQPGVLFLSGHHCNNTTKGSVQPRPMTGAFSCCWSYVRRLKISKTAKFQGESSSLGSTAAIKEKEAEHPPAPTDPYLVSWCAEHCLFSRVCKGSCFVQWENCGWCFQRKVWFLLCQTLAFDKPGSVLLVCLPLHKPSGLYSGGCVRIMP